MRSIYRPPAAGLDLLGVRPASEAGAPRPCPRLLVLNLPRDWMVADAAAAVFATRDYEATIQPIVRALIPELPAVLEVPFRPIEGCRARPAEPVAEVLGADRGLRVDASARPIVAIGIGEAGSAVLAATREEVASRHLDPDRPRLAAAIALGGDGPAVYAIDTPQEGQACELRAPLLCQAMARATSQVRLSACLIGLAIDQAAAQSDHRLRR